MFTGLVADLGRIEAVNRGEDGVRLTVASSLAGELALGDSVAVNGVCLTAIEVDPDREQFATEVMNETLRLSSLAELAAGAEVNLELAMRPTDRFGGHIVQGHVDGVGSVTATEPDGFATRMTIGAAPEVLRYLVHKGSITVNGVSLTVAAVDDRSFTVSLIPETLERTNLGRARSGDTVNLEVDVLAKYVEKAMRSNPGVAR